MYTVHTNQACAELPRLIDEAVKRHEPIEIAGMTHNAVLVSREDWDAIQETLYLLSIPGMRESIREGMETPAEQCAAELNW